MKLGSETGSFVNHMYSRAVIGQPVPEVRMGCTLLSWTDRHAATIVEVDTTKKNKVRLFVVQDHAKVVSGSPHDGSASYEYTPNPKGARIAFDMQPDGTWRQVYQKSTAWDENGNPIEWTHRWTKCKPGYGLRIGEREEYYDPSF